MSYYDNIKIQLAQLPLSEADKQRLKVERPNFQTKSLEGMYGAYEITSEGYLEKTVSSGVIGPDGRTIWHDVRLVDAHGVVVFYGYADNEWFYFKARFREGRIIDLLRLKKLPEVGSRTCVWELEIPIDQLKPAYDTEAIQRELSLLDAHQRQHLEDEFANFD